MNFIVFPGQGSQYPGMGKDLYQNFSEVKVLFEEVSDHSHLKIKELCFEASEQEISQTELTQPLIFTVSMAAWKVLGNFQDLEELRKNSLFAGHSLGEYGALVAMKVLPLGETAALLHKRGLAMKKASTGGMAALILKAKDSSCFDQLSRICASISQDESSFVAPANFNAPGQIVVSGSLAGLEQLKVKLSSEETFPLRKFIPLKVSAPFHSKLMEPAAESFEKELSKASFVPQSSCSYIPNVTAKASTAEDIVEIQELLKQQIPKAVLWYPSLLEAKGLGVVNQWELGPGAVLGNISKRLDLSFSQVESFEKKEDFDRVFGA